MNPEIFEALFLKSERYDIIKAQVGTRFLFIIPAKRLTETEIAQVCARVADDRNY
jgi:hypothetical protein